MGGDVGGIRSCDLHEENVYKVKASFRLLRGESERRKGGASGVGGRGGAQAHRGSRKSGGHERG